MKYTKQHNLEVLKGVYSMAYSFIKSSQCHKLDALKGILLLEEMKTVYSFHRKNPEDLSGNEFNRISDIAVSLNEMSLDELCKKYSERRIRVLDDSLWGASLFYTKSAYFQYGHENYLVEYNDCFKSKLPKTWDCDDVVYINSEDYPYTAREILEICKGNLKLAHDVFILLDGQCPYTLISEFVQDGELILVEEVYDYKTN